MKSQNPRVNLFTLTELLIVMAILAVLVSLLSPALKRSMGFARNMACQSNLKQIGGAVNLYCSDNDDSLPPSMGYAPVLPQEYWPSYLLRGGYITAPVKLTTNDSSGDSVLRCSEGLDAAADVPFNAPIDYRFRDKCAGYSVTAYGANRYLYFWYGINSVTNNLDTPFPFDGIGQKIGNRIVEGKKLTSFRRPWVLMGIYDGVMFHNGNLSRISARHQDRTLTNILFMDLHVASIDTITIPTYYTNTDPQCNWGL